MEVDIIAIGNSKGFRLPKAVLAQCGFGDKAEMRVVDGKLVLSKSKKKKAPREGWEESMRAVKQPKSDLDFLAFDNAWDKTEWVW